MHGPSRTRAVEKLAFFGPAAVSGSPVYAVPAPTVGQAMIGVGSFPTFSEMQRRQALDQIVSTGVDVNSPVRRLFGAGLGLFAGKAVAKALGFGPFAQGVAATLGGQYGYKF